MKRNSLLIFMSLVSLCAGAQTVSNIRAQQEGRDIVVYYDLSDEANISLRVYFDKKKQKIHLLDGDIGRKVQGGKSKRIVWHVLDEKGSRFLKSNVVFTVKATTPYHTIILGEAGISALPFTPSGGLMLGGVGKVGWYIKARTNFMWGKQNENGTMDTNGNKIIIRNDEGIETLIPDVAMQYYMTGKHYTKHWVADAGLIVRCLHKSPYDLYVYFGAGYGERKQIWQTLQDDWLVYKPTHHKNISGDAGLLFSYKKLMLSAGINTIGYKYIDMQLGIGVKL